jgi:excisionase family DNA binding protein
MSTVNIKRAAEILCVHPNRVAKLIQDGALPAGRVGRAYVMLERDVLALAEQIIVNQTAERMRRKAA